MQLEFSQSTTQHLQVTQDMSRLFKLPEVVSLLDSCPQLKTKGEKHLVAVSFIGATRMQSLNSIYRKKGQSTDVLSFELNENGILGELYVCPDDIAKNAKAIGHGLAHEFIEIIVHGLLHLTGYDHSDEMFDWQKSLTERILELYETYRRTW